MKMANPVKIQEKITTEDAEKYAKIIEKFTEFLRCTAIDDHIRFGTYTHTPELHDRLVVWCKNMDNLDKCTESIRRTMSRYIPTERMFAIQDSSNGLDWRAIESVLKSSIDNLVTVVNFMEIMNKDSKFDDDIKTLDLCLERMKKVQENGWIRQMLPPDP